MKAKDLAAKLLEHPELDVLFSDQNEGSVCSVENVRIETAEEDQYPKDWNMPEGYTFWKLSLQ